MGVIKLQNEEKANRRKERNSKPSPQENLKHDKNKRVLKKTQNTI